MAFAEPPSYTAYRTSGGIVLDGILDESDWALAPSLGDFSFPWWSEGTKEQTEAKMLWDNTYLYIAISCDDRYIWADHVNTYDWTYKDDCAEFFWNPSPDQSDTYYFFEMNCIGNILCVWDYQGEFLENKARLPRIATAVNGTVNKDYNVDTGWVLEIAIRFDDYTELYDGRTPDPGDVWRVNVNRCGGQKNAQYSQWSPSRTEQPNFHRPEDFGYLSFSGKTVENQTGIDNSLTEPEALTLSTYPNPFNPSVTVSFNLAKAGKTSLEIYNIAGQKVATLADGHFPAGVHEVRWNALDADGLSASSGIYFAHLRSNGVIMTRRMLLIR